MTALPEDFFWRLVTDERGLGEVLDHARRSTFTVYDIENSDERVGITASERKKPARPHQGRLMLLGLGFDEGTIYVIPWEHKQGPDTPVWHRLVHGVAVDVLEELPLNRCAHNGKYDYRWLASRLVYPKQTFDTMLAVYLLNENEPKALEYQAKVRYGAPSYGKFVEYNEDYPLAKLAKYCALDIYYCRKLYLDTRRELVQDQGLARVFKYIMVPGANALGRIEDRGMWAYEEKLAEAQQTLEAEVARLLEELEDISPIKRVNWNSPRQKARVFFSNDGLGLDPFKATATGAPSTDKEVLKRLASEHPLANTLRKYNEARDQLKFVKAWVEYIEDSKQAFGVPRIYPIYNIARTVTGRLSCEDPNLQQVPRGPIVRNIIGAPPGKVFMEADGSQMELRGAAHEAQEQTMIRLLREGRDLHRHTAAEIAGIPDEAVTREQRQGAKAANFGLLYGQQARGFRNYAFLNYDVDWSLEEATEVRERWFEVYDGILPWHKRCERIIRDHGHIRSATGRIRRLPEIDSPDAYEQFRAIRQGINFTVQSLSSDIVVLSIIELDRMNDPRFEIVGTVHDSILLEVDENHVDEVAALVKDVMENIVPNQRLPEYFNVKLAVPIVAEISVGKYWGSLEEMEVRA